MSFRIHEEAGEVLVDQEYDMLEARLREGGRESVRGRCLDLLSNPETAEESKPWISTLLGLSELGDQRYEEALTYCAFGRAAPDPYGPKAIAGMAWALMGLQRGNEAFELLQSGLVQHPNSGPILEALGMFHLGMNHHDEAWSKFVKAYTISPLSNTTLSSLVALGCRAERIDELERILSTMLEEQPWNLDVRGFLAVVLMLRGDIEQVRREFARVSTFAAYTKVSPHVLQAMKEVMAGLMGSGKV
jgi:Tfp pilus assembly protein PilF